MPDNERIPFVPNGNKQVGNERIPFTPKPVQLKNGDSTIVAPTYTNPHDIEVDNAINFIDKQAVESGRPSLSEERKSVLKDVLRNPLSTKEQKEKAILTVQGYDKDTNGEASNKFYMKREDNGIYIPTLIKHGERAPKDASINSFHGTQEDANDDAWYTDLGKSVANGVVSTAGGLVDLAQAGQTLVTGEENKYLTDARNSIDFFKFKKDEDLNTPVYNTEGIDKWSDLVDKNRLDLSPKALWGTFNGLAESLTEFGLGTAIGGTAIKGIKGATELGKAGQRASVFFGSGVSQLGENLDAAGEAGLKGRDKAAAALSITAAMSAIDATYGLEGKIMSSLYKKSKRQILENAIKGVEKNAAGEITEQGFKDLMKQTTVQYGAMAKNGIKEVVKDAVQEGSQEAAQDFVQKAGEQLWDKMTPDERGQYGTDALSAKSFGNYIASFAVGGLSGVPMAVAQHSFKRKQDEQSVNIYDRVKEGPQAVNALKADLGNALENNDINQDEYEVAIHKINSYDKYHQETKDVNLNPEHEKRAFELSYQIEGLKTEIPTNENEISKLAPIERAKVESKQHQVKGLQKELNDIILTGQVKGEPVVDKKTEEKIAKEKDKVATENAENLSKEAENISNLKQKQEKSARFEVHEKPVSQPKYTEDKRTYDEIPAEEFNNHFTNARTVHRVLRKKLSELPKQEMVGKLFAHEYSYKSKGKTHNNRTIKVALEDGRIVKLASSKIREDSLLSGHTHTENVNEISTNENYKGEVPPVVVGVKVIDLNDTKGYNMPEGYKSSKKLIKVYNKENGKFISWVKETNSGNENAKDKNGNPLYTEEEKDLMGHLKTIKEDVNPEDLKAANETPITPPVPVTKRAEETTNKIVEESKKSISEEQGKELPTLEEQQKEELKSAKKPELKLNFITKRDVLDKVVKATAVEKESGNEIEMDVKVSKVQSQIKKKLKVLELLNNCIHG